MGQASPPLMIETQLERSGTAPLAVSFDARHNDIAGKSVDTLIKESWRWESLRLRASDTPGLATVFSALEVSNTPPETKGKNSTTRRIPTELLCQIFIWTLPYTRRFGDQIFDFSPLGSLSASDGFSISAWWRISYSLFHHHATLPPLFPLARGCPASPPTSTTTPLRIGAAPRPSVSCQVVPSLQCEDAAATQPPRYHPNLAVPAYGDSKMVKGASRPSYTSLPRLNASSWHTVTCASPNEST
ncbi:hypothetical protein DFH08DRAFT_1084464 [Mycena albidolilacea]|uniref:Uncharacterized protein n=1 Tax=Mycena albidolilacea TaxID=1033008 RepID=A0AAD6ZMH5_9AGAR|nr:hypothetical protein DFH08DRAFT_1084464 [Mycena albidolilacea]